MAENLLEVKNLKKYFKTNRGLLHAVDDVTFTLEKGKTLGIVGESGCGKSTTGRCILRLIEPTSGQVIFEGQDIVALNKRQMREKRKDIQIIFRILSPRWTPEIRLCRLLLRVSRSAASIKHRRRSKHACGS